MLFPDGRIMVFCKAPEAGKVKTRLAKSIGEAAATTVHEHLAWQCLKNIFDAHIAPIELWCAPDVEHDFFQRCVAEFAVVLKKQNGTCLGDRMEHAFSEGLQHSQQVIIVGTDCPAMNADFLASAFSDLSGHDSVIGPAEDGGYVLLGLRKRQPIIFSNMPWGTAQVLENTLSRLTGSVKVIDTLWDVDYVEDLIRLRSEAGKLQLGKAFSAYLAGLELGV